MSETLVWWAMTQVVGLAVLPLCLALFVRLPDRGYTLSKPFALLAVGYVFWILNVLNVLPNTTGGIWLVVLLFFAASGYLLWRQRDELADFVRARWWLIGATEVVFFLSFVTAAYLRSYVPDLGGTEKPMDFMFLNAVTRGDGFPPADPWLAGRDVSYYYFGYLIVSIMTRLSGLATSVGFNLGLAMIVGLAVTAAFGLVYNLAAPREERHAAAGPGTPAGGFSTRPLWRPMAFGLVAAFLLTVMGNLEGVLEWLAAHGFGSDGFWSWVGVANLANYDSPHWYPDQFWFWWKATRILDGGVGIHEFPFFSFLLGDLHPHVMSIPFVLLAAGVGLALLRSDEPLDLVVWLERPLWLVAFGVVLGGLAFLNTWDMPTMAFVIALLAVVRNRLLAGRWSWGLAADTLGFLVPLFVVGFLAYTPFFFGGFDSQASGFTAETGAGTRLFHTFLLWGPFATIVLPYAAWRVARSGAPVTLRAALWSLAPLAAVVLLWLVWDVLAGVFSFLPPAVRPNDGAAGFADRITDRGWNWLTVLVVGGALGLLGLALVREIETAKDAAGERFGHIVALALSTTAALLILGAEFFFIQDTFGSRMNTIFKLYYQSWLLLSIAGGFALYELARSLRPPRLDRLGASLHLERWTLGDVTVLSITLAGAVLGAWLAPGLLALRLLGAIIGAGCFFVAAGGALLLWRATAPQPRPGGLEWRSVWAGGIAVVLLAAFVYPLLATFNRTEAFDLPRTLDGLERVDADTRAAIDWLSDRDGQPVIAEGLGDDYTDGGRVSAATGLPTILQWPGHQLQWRGTSDPQTGRPEDLERLYTSRDPNEVKSILQQYGISYVVLGQHERQRYGETGLSGLTDLLEPAFEQGDITIYRVRPGVLAEVSREPNE